MANHDKLSGTNSKGAISYNEKREKSEIKESKDVKVLDRFRAKTSSGALITHGLNLRESSNTKR